jgi:hypothetical protein
MRKRIIKRVITSAVQIGTSNIIRKTGVNNNPGSPKNISNTVIPRDNNTLNWGKVDMSTVVYSKVEQLFKNETVFIVGGGPSLKDFNWDLLKGKHVIAINKAIYVYPNADIIYWTDSRFYKWYKNDIDALSGVKYTIQPSPNQENVKILRRGNRHGLEINPSLLAHGDNSGYAAINLAYHLGAKNIVLLGYDMGNENGKGHFHDGYPVSHTSDDIYQNRFMTGFPIIADELKQRGIKVFNASLISKLTCFSKISIKDALLL